MDENSIKKDCVFTFAGGLMDFLKAGERGEEKRYVN
jgi:hypothetical protein